MMTEKYQRKLLIIFTICWTSVCFSYYLLVFNFADFKGGNLYLNGFALALSELIGNLIFGTVLAAIGLKNTLVTSFSLCALSPIVYLLPIIPLDIWYAATLFIIKLSITCAFAATFYGMNALFRVDLIPVMFALCNMVARLITMGAPAIDEDIQVMAIVMTCGISGVIATVFIEE